VSALPACFIIEEVIGCVFITFIFLTITLVLGLFLYDCATVPVSVSLLIKEWFLCMSLIL